MSEPGEGRAESGAEAAMLEVRKMDGRSVDETLRMIARMPAPEGLEERVKAGIRLAEQPGHVLAWPSARFPVSVGPQSGWMRGWARGAAAAAIALVVAGGGWGIYTRVAPAQSAKTVALPPSQPSGTFSESGAMRRPQTLNGPVVKPEAEPNEVRPAQKAQQPVVHSAASKTKPFDKLRAGSGPLDASHATAPTR